MLIFFLDEWKTSKYHSQSRQDHLARWKINQKNILPNYISSIFYIFYNKTIKKNNINISYHFPTSKKKKKKEQIIQNKTKTKEVITATVNYVFLYVMKESS